MATEAEAGPCGHKPRSTGAPGVGGEKAGLLEGCVPPSTARLTPHGQPPRGGGRVCCKPTSLW